MALDVIPYIPAEITVHLGPPNVAAENVTLPFIDYIKNVASSEIYPTWPEEALRANILAQISFALNRVYTEYYRSRGYNFNITSYTGIDQKFIKDRTIFQNISELVDEIFDQYIRREGFVEPLLAQYCNGTTSTCPGLSQWGSEDLANQGYDHWSILEHYYGTNIELVTDAPIHAVTSSFPTAPLTIGATGDHVLAVQTMLNRISKAYPLIPAVVESGIYDQDTANAVRIFQSVFNLNQDGIVGKATWNKLLYLYVGLTRLAELNSEGQTRYLTRFQDPTYVTPGDTGDQVSTLQYVLNILAEFDSSIPSVPITGTYDDASRAAVIAFQNKNGLIPSGIVDPETWALMLDQYRGIRDTALQDPGLLPPETLAPRNIPIDQVEASLAQHRGQYPGTPLGPGSRD